MKARRKDHTQIAIRRVLAGIRIQDQGQPQTEEVEIQEAEDLHKQEAADPGTQGTMQQQTQGATEAETRRTCSRIS